MAGFTRKLRGLCEEALSGGVLNQEQAQAVCRLAEERSARGVALGGVLSVLGGITLLLGCVLLIAANWECISDAVKLGLFFLLFCGCHIAGFWLSLRKRVVPWAPQILHFIGMGLFLGGIGLVAQIYHLDNHAPNAILTWLVATAPLAVLLRSVPLAGMSLLALLIWVHMEGAADDSAVQLPESYSAWMVIEAGMGVAFVIGALLLERWKTHAVMVFRVAGIAQIAVVLYSLGFYRHYAEGSPNYSSQDGWGGLVLPLAAAAIGVIFLAVLWSLALVRRPAGWLSQAVMYTLLLGLTVYGAGEALGLFSRWGCLDFVGVKQLDFAPDPAAFFVTVGAWALWFGGSFWFMLDGARLGNRGTIGLGVAGIVIGVITRFFDLIRSQSLTGIVFLGIGVLLLVAAGWGVQRWQKKRMTAQAADA